MSDTINMVEITKLKQEIYNLRLELASKDIRIQYLRNKMFKAREELKE